MSFKSVAARVSLALAVSGALAAVPVAAGGPYGGYHGGYYGGPRGCYNCGYNNNGNVFGAVVGTAVALGFIAAIASASKPKTVVAPQPAYAPVYPQQPYQQPAPMQTPPVQQQAIDPSQTAAGAQAEMCARAAERTAQNYGGFARTVSIDSITGEQANAVIRGTLEINPNNGQPVNRAAFTCSASYGQVIGVQLG